MNSIIQGPLLGQGTRCEPIIRALPDWFGIEEAIVRYINEVEDLPTFIASQNEQAVGFLSVKHRKERKECEGNTCIVLVTFAFPLRPSCPLR